VVTVAIEWIFTKSIGDCSIRISVRDRCARVLGILVPDHNVLWGRAWPVSTVINFSPFFWGLIKLSKSSLIHIDKGAILQLMHWNVV
jgi:hypothetical protein